MVKRITDWLLAVYLHENLEDPQVRAVGFLEAWINVSGILFFRLKVIIGVAWCFSLLADAATFSDVITSVVVLVGFIL